jgi:hypothetical protein
VALKVEMAARREVLIQAAGAVPHQTKLKWQAAFSQFDIAKNGVISVEELRQVMVQKLHMTPKDGEVENMVAAVDLNGDSVISYEEFELMMVAAGRGSATGSGFAHVVYRLIRMPEITALINAEANNFVHNFCQQHRETFAGLTTPDVASGEQLPAYYDAWQMFKEEGELMMQSSMLLWGTAQMKTFEPEFLEEMNQTGILDSFLRYLDYPAFIQLMYHSAAQQQQSDQHPAAAGISRPQTALGEGSVQKRLAELDRALTQLDYQRNQLLAERRRLVGCEVDSVTTGALKQQLELAQYRDDVGND